MFVFLIETKARAETVEFLRVRLGFEGLLCVERSGMGGGLTLFWCDRDAVML